MGVSAAIEQCDLYCEIILFKIILKIINYIKLFCIILKYTLDLLNLRIITPTILLDNSQQLDKICKDINQKAS